jgi:hypothetical protein
VHTVHHSGGLIHKLSAHHPARSVAPLLAALALCATAIHAAPLGLAWGRVAEPAEAGAIAPGAVAEHLEFLSAHGFEPVRASGLERADAPAQAVLLTFDDPASAERFVLPLLELYHAPAAVTVSEAQSADPTLRPALVALALSPWIELVPRVEPEAGSSLAAVRCDAAPRAGASEEESLSRLYRSLAATSSRLRELTGAEPPAVAWAPGAWSGPAEAVAASLGLSRQLPTFAGMPPPLDAPRVARYALPSWAGIWALVQASVHWDPEHHPVRFVEVDAGWVCAGGDPQARVGRVVSAVRALGLNGVRILPGDSGGAWFETTSAPVRGDVVGPLARALHEAGVRWVAVDLLTTGDAGRDVALATDLSREVDLDVALLPAGAAQGRLGEAVRYVRPAARLGRRGEAGLGEPAFRLDPFAPGQPPARGLTVAGGSVGAANREATDRAIAGWEWIGLPLELAESGLSHSLRSLAAFALPAAGKHAEP